MGVEHELRERAVEAGHRALQHDEAGAGELACRLEVEAGAGRGDVVVLEGSVGEVARAAPAADLDVGGLVGAVRDVVHRQVGNALEQILEGCVGHRGVGLELADLGLPLGDEGAQPIELGLVAAGPGGADGLARVVPLGQRGLGGGDAGAAGAVEGQDLVGERREAAAGQRGVEGLRRLADQADVVHGDRSGSRALCRNPAAGSTGRQSGTDSTVSRRIPALARSAACSVGSSSGMRSARTPAAPTTRGIERATSRTRSTSGVTMETEKTARSSQAMAAITRARPAPMPYQVAPLPSMMV